MRSINNNEVHVWHNKMFSNTNLDYDILSSEEVFSSRNYPSTAQRRKYLYSKVILREILSLYLDIPSHQIKFSHNKFGKPYLKNSSNIFFNLSHTSNDLCIAVSATNEIGVDIESAPESHTMSELIDYFLTENELEIIKNLDSSNIETQLLRLWTQKEAITKSIGHSLERTLKHLTLPIDKKFYDYMYNNKQIHVREFLVSHKTIGAIASTHKVDKINNLNYTNAESRKMHRTNHSVSYSGISSH